MTLFLLAYLGGVLTILSPCILPVLPFVLARADQPFKKSGLPFLLGMAGAFAAVATLGAVGGSWAAQANQFGRGAATTLLAAFGVTLVIPKVAERVMRPVVAFGSWLSHSADNRNAQRRSPFLTSALLGTASGLLWAPCAGPILGLLLTGAALNGANFGTSLLLLAYALGAATSLAAALLMGGGLIGAMKRSLGVGEWVRRGLGVAVLAGVAAIAFGVDTGALTRISLAGPSSVEQNLIDKVRSYGADDAAKSSVVMNPDVNGLTSGSIAMTSGSSMMMVGDSAAAKTGLHVGGQFPSLAGATEWLNSPPLTVEGLRGKVVLVDFWTYSCINCLRALPYVRAWAEKYKDRGLVVIGVHAPEFAFEKDVDNVKAQAKALNVDYPVAINNDYAIWRAFGNQFWPAHYLIDAKGVIRHHHFGEGDYAESQRIIQQLLAESGAGTVPNDLVAVSAKGPQTALDRSDKQSRETYIGFDRAENFASLGGMVADAIRVYALPEKLDLNQWALAGEWRIGSESAVSTTAGARIVFHFHARNLQLVLGPAASGQLVRYRVLIDGKPPGEAHGADVDAQGRGVVDAQRLFQLIHQNGPVADHQFDIEFSAPGAQAYAYTFG
jgi:cytochrome c biogenesis protein CcdA/thiol-disulfide isomerase/thioredoxin